MTGAPPRPVAAGLDAPPAVRLIDIDRAFGKVQAVRGVSLDVREGEFLVLLGPSGSGKTTLLRVIAGFEEPSRGDIAIRGRPVGDVPPNQRDIGVVFQHFALFPHLTVFGNVAFGLEMRRVRRDELRSRVAEALQMVRLVGYDTRLPSQLSGGQQQRVALARALVTRPAVLLLDEPLGSLDPHLRGEMQAEIRRLQQTLAITAIMVTHDQQEAMTMADRIAILHEGRLEQLGTPREIYQAPASAFVARFIGAANIIAATVSGRDNGRLLLAAPGGLTIAASGAGERRPGESINAIIRPEQIRLDPEHSDVANSFPGRVTAVTYIGPVTRCQVTIGADLPITMMMPAEAAHATIAVGDNVRIGWHASATVLVPGG